jgi:hypothetical protein
LKIDDAIASAILSANGRVAYVVTHNSRLLRIDVAALQITELAASTPEITAPYLLNATPADPVTAAAAGSVLDLVGFGNMRSADFCGHPSPHLPGSGTRFQVPFDAPDGNCQVIVRGESPFENSFSLSIVPFAPRFSSILHEGFTGPVTPSNPARSGEKIVVYMTGLGRPGSNIAASDTSGHLGGGFNCMFDNVPADVLYAGLTPDFPGVYQVNIQVPGLSPRQASLLCGFPGNGLVAGYYASTTVPIGGP